MSNPPVKSLVSRAFEAALSLAITVWLLSWAWAALQPLIPVMVAIAGLVVLVMLAIRRFRGW